MKRRISWGAVALATLIAAGCGGGGNNSSSTTTVGVSGKKCAATIAIEAPLTGPASQVGLQQLHFAELAVANDNQADGTDVTLAHDDTQLSPALATSRTQSIIASNAVATVGPAGSPEVAAVGSLFGRAGMGFVSGSATLPALATDGMNPTFFRVVPDDDVLWQQDANYAINHLHPKAVILIDDGGGNSRGLVNMMSPVFQRAGVKVTRLSYNGTDTGATLSRALSLLATRVTAQPTVLMLPWQTSANAQQFGLDFKQQGKHVTLFVSGTDTPGQFKIPGSFVSAFGPDISMSTSSLDKSILSGVTKYGPYGPYGVPTYEATDVVMKAIFAACKAGQTPNRADVLAQIKNTNIPASRNVLGIPVAFDSNGDLAGNYGYLFKIGPSGTYTQVNPK